MRFDASLRQRWDASGEVWRFEMPEGWMQGRSVYGGITGAAAASLALRNTEAQRRLRTITVQFLRPVVPGPLEGTHQVLRSGRNVTFVRVTLCQGGQDAVVATIVLARPIEGTTAVVPKTWPGGPPPQSLTDIPYCHGIMPEFIQQFGLRWADSRLPYSDADQAEFSGYCRFHGPAGDEEGIIALLDAWPCPTLCLLNAPAPASSVTWTAHILPPPKSFDGWFPFTYKTIAGRDGYHTVAAHLYAPDGTLAGWSEQLVAVFG